MLHKSPTERDAVVMSQPLLIDNGDGGRYNPSNARTVPN